MPPRRRHVTDQGFGYVSHFQTILATLLFPVLLIIFSVRCEKNFCVLFQLHFSLPTHAGAYFSLPAVACIVGFIAIQFSWSKLYLYIYKNRSGPKDGGSDLNEPKPLGGFWSLLCFTVLLFGLRAFSPETICFLNSEHAKLLLMTWILCLIVSFAAALSVITHSKLDKKKNDKVIDEPYLKLFFYGYRDLNFLAGIEMKQFCYVNLGLVGWAVLDLLVVLNPENGGMVSKSAIFVVVTQLMFIAHTVYFEDILLKKKYLQQEKIGYNWLQKVVIFLPFLGSLVTKSAAVPGFDISMSMLLANIVFFLFGFVIHTDSTHFLQVFKKDPKKSITKRFLAARYYRFVKKPDLFGLGIMWTTWAIAGGLNAISVIALGVWLGTLAKWARDSESYNKECHQDAWNDYCKTVPKKLIPFVY